MAELWRKEEKSKGWVGVDHKGSRSFHTYPANDLAPHKIGPDDDCSCECVPSIEHYKNGNYQVIHNAWDGRD